MILLELELRPAGGNVVISVVQSLVRNHHGPVLNCFKCFESSFWSVVCGFSAHGDVRSEVRGHSILWDVFFPPVTTDVISVVLGSRKMKEKKREREMIMNNVQNQNQKVLSLLDRVCDSTGSVIEPGL